MTSIYCINIKLSSSLSGLEKYIFTQILNKIPSRKIGQPRRLRKMFLLTGSYHRRQLIFHWYRTTYTRSPYFTVRLHLFSQNCAQVCNSCVLTWRKPTWWTGLDWIFYYLTTASGLDQIFYILPYNSFWTGLDILLPYNSFNSLEKYMFKTI